MLSETSEHVLRAVAWMAARENTEAFSADSIARGARVPRRYLSKILARLTSAGILSARRGVKGGYRLARPPASIRLWQLIEPFESSLGETFCIFGAGRRCTSRTPCAFHQAWAGVRNPLNRFLRGTTLAQISDGKRGTRRG